MSLCFNKPDFECDYNGTTCTIKRQGYVHINRKGIKKQFIAEILEYKNKKYCYRYTKDGINSKVIIKRLENKRPVELTNNVDDLEFKDIVNVMNGLTKL
ncbi:hypothetical protein [Clostridium sp. YIM B02555]|uniref:hypothetical protein n=1 Tax=Clostridium sp. YIM B02555 TaxID=2911968 RepID=UPI001EED9315|nr:hypothetical protein [Clostridium sp. YIM B02555]